ncbi:helix-turn-helix domain-containing protein [Amycolatopsis tolypomycina]|uniref:PucR C-terminal helix-turn-helix domain-containing protein n=1 Tax=Amycolatopsis tolypomycina TaxID=208445 RepID=A0A1H4T1M8_9PSEU|nr:helix-turn-helix domain-containing protein [Amycolatopsis tolypomycina]SEC50327.1 PucR C-terminal helix-turn-helix domain-containing protein [Amycolatopsis tolypomycina]
MTSTSIRAEAAVRPEGTSGARTAFPAVAGLPAELRAEVVAVLEEQPRETRAVVRRLLGATVAALVSGDRRAWTSAREAEETIRAGSALAAAGVRPDPLLVLVGRLTAWAVERAAGAEPASAGRLKDVVRVGHAVTRGLAGGFHRHARSRAAAPLDGERLAAALLSGQRVPGAAASYQVLAVRCGHGVLDRLPALGGVALTRGCAGFLLVPEAGPGRGPELAAGLRAALPAAWVAPYWARTAEVPAAAATAADVVALAAGSGAPAGVHRLEDFAVEYAALRHPAIEAELRRLIEPVLAGPGLAGTLRAFVRADGNRTRAAAELIVHRSTLDYRLKRIAQLTGYDPVKPAGLQVLAIAMTTAHARTVRAQFAAVPDPR